MPWSAEVGSCTVPDTTVGRSCGAGAIGRGIGMYDGLLGPGTGSSVMIALVSVLGHGFLVVAGPVALELACDSVLPLF
jgi:uncharacterized membrane protein YfcA